MAAEAIRQLEAMVQGDLRPDLTLLLDAPVRQALQRAHQRNAGAPADRFETERGEFFERVAAAYRLRAELEPRRVAVIDAAQTADAVTTQILDVLKKRSWIS
jgi:dTMP kinase